MGTLSPLLTCMETPFWRMELKRVLKGTVRVVDVSSAVVARLRVTLPDCWAWVGAEIVRRGRSKRRLG